MARTRRERPTSRIVVYRDAEGNPLNDPAAADGGEIIENDHEGRAGRRLWFRMVEVELPWVRISEAAFLLWVLALLVLVWLLIALLLLVL